MKKLEVIFSIVCGISVAWVVSDFFILYNWAFFILLPLLFVVLVDAIERIFKNTKIVGQGIRHILTGAFADIADIKIFQLLFWIFPAGLTIKTISFLASAVIKYFGNKIWVFNKNDGHSIKEASQFLFVTIIGLIINVSSFYCATLLLPNTKIYTEISVIFALLVTAIWNFLGYKLIVFKK
jgi:putative flippase GtrA